jgi:hypothetical protein
VAYLSATTSVFQDPFFKGFDETANNANTSLVNDTRYYNYSGDYLNGRIYDSSQDGSIDVFRATSEQLSALNHWHLRSRGPDGNYSKRSVGWADYLLYHGTPGTGATSTNGGLDSLYDPTNGTASKGDIVRLGTNSGSN